LSLPVVYTSNKDIESCEYIIDGFGNNITGINNFEGGSGEITPVMKPGGLLYNV